MTIGFGKHRGSTVERVVLTDPSYVLWMMCLDDPSGPLLAAREKAERLIQAFDRKPFVEKCQGTGCGRPAARATVYGSSLGAVYWCSECDPHQMGAFRGRLQSVCTYWDAVRHVGAFCDGRKADYGKLIFDLAEAKGLARPVTGGAVEAFFSR